jgi:hypothetical protein
MYPVFVSGDGRMSVNYRVLVEQLASPDNDERLNARQTLLEMDEDALEPLTNVFYGGVNDTQGVAVLELVAEIGGPDALSMLRNVFYFEDQRVALKQKAAHGLLQNRANLSPNEIEEVTAYLDSI